VTSDEAIELVEGAVGPGSLFGADPVRTYRRLARLTHPDVCHGTRAEAAFKRLTQLWEQHSTGGVAMPVVIASGDIANLYKCERGLAKVARDPRDNDLLGREVAALTRVRDHGEPRFAPFFPELTGRTRYRDPVTGVERRANALVQLESEFTTLADVRAAYPAGLDPRDAAWMWRRLLVAVGAAHRAGVIHAAVTPENVMIHPGKHGLVLLDWCYALTPGEHAVAVPRAYRDWYPPEVLAHSAPGTDLDTWLISRCMMVMMGEQAPRQLEALARGCQVANSAQRPADAWQLLRELDDVLERLYGPRKFRPFKMPAPAGQMGA
jgi:serine/threonine protein kinase